MCGICGIYSIKPIGARKREKLRYLHKEINPRGPDYQADWVDFSNRVMLAHSRLQIVDLSENGNQPMHYSNLTIVYNGEIYNYLELKKELKNFGYTFFSETDTEVILKGYDLWGKEVVNKLNGQFAFAIWDKEKNQIILARDRFGMKPLYYTYNENEFWFSSYLPALIRHSSFPKTIDQSAVHFFFSMQGVIPAPNTPYKEFKKIPPGHIAIVETKEDNTIGFYEEQYYTLNFLQNTKLDMSTENIQKLVHDSLLKSIEYRLQADVDVGIWLSGGIDSSLIVAIVAEEFGYPVNTFSIGFETAYGELGNEFEYSDYVANKYRAKHQKILISKKEMIESLPDCQRSINEPMMSHDLIGYYLLSKYSRASDIKVILTGVGADEIWLGYGWYQKYKLLPIEPYKKFKTILYEYEHDELSKYLNSEFLQYDYADKFIQEYFKNLTGTDLEKAIQADIMVLMVDDPVKRADSTSMRFGVEVRAPFLDHTFVELSTRIPVELKEKNGIGKYLLKKLAERYFHHSFIHRTKGYFPVPEIKFTVGEVQDFCGDVLLSSNCKSRGILNMSQIKKLLDSDPQISHIGGNPLWQMTCFEFWLNQFD